MNVKEWDKMKTPKFVQGALPKWVFNHPIYFYCYCIEKKNVRIDF